METILGRTASGPIKASQIELWELNHVTETQYETSELSALCPVTKQPDIYRTIIQYTSACTFESKGMKHYLWGFRNLGIGCEELAGVIAQELTDRLQSSVTVTLVQQVRGGLVLQAKVTGNYA